MPPLPRLPPLLQSFPARREREGGREGGGAGGRGGRLLEIYRDPNTGPDGLSSFRPSFFSTHDQSSIIHQRSTNPPSIFPPRVQGPRSQLPSFRSRLPAPDRWSRGFSSNTGSPESGRCEVLFLSLSSPSPGLAACGLRLASVSLLTRAP